MPLALAAGVNVAKFGTLFGLPFDRQFITLVSPEHRAVLRANGGSLFGLQFLPTNLLVYLRPDGIDLVRLFPWVRFPAGADVIGHVSYDRITPTSSAVAAMPLHAILGIVGAVAIVSPRRARESGVAALRAPVAGALVATGPVLVFGFLAQRYVGDFLPLFVLLGALGLHVALAWCTRTVGRRRTVSWAALAVGAFVAIWFAAGLAVLYQQITATDDGDLRAFVRHQFALARRVPGGSPDLTRVTRLPESAALGTVAVVGDCAGTYVSTGISWRALERSPATGGYRVRADFTRAFLHPAAPTTTPLLSAGTAARPMTFSVETRPNGRSVFGYTPPDGRVFRGRPVTIRPGEHRVDVVLDPRTQEAGITVGGRAVLTATTIPAVRTIVDPPGPVRLGDGGGVALARGRFPGAIRRLPVRTPLCRELTDHS